VSVGVGLNVGVGVGPKDGKRPALHAAVKKKIVINANTIQTKDLSLFDIMKRCIPFIRYYTPDSQPQFSDFSSLNCLISKTIIVAWIDVNGP
jgi:hypothetical protein